MNDLIAPSGAFFIAQITATDLVRRADAVRASGEAMGVSDQNIRYAQDLANKSGFDVAFTADATHIDGGTIYVNKDTHHPISEAVELMVDEGIRTKLQKQTQANIKNGVAYDYESLSKLNDGDLRTVFDTMRRAYAKTLSKEQGSKYLELTDNPKTTSEMVSTVRNVQGELGLKEDVRVGVDENASNVDETETLENGGIDDTINTTEEQGARTRQEAEEQAFFDQINEVGKRTDLSNEQKVSAIQEAFEALTDKWDILVPADVKFLTAEGFSRKGKPLYDWPACLGFVKETVRAITRENFSTSTFSRLGSKYGNNASTQPSDGTLRSVDELGTPYRENYSARHTFEMNDTYFDVIDAIREDSLDGLNQVLEHNGRSPIDHVAFKDIKSSYDYFIKDANMKLKKFNVKSDPTYGLTGTVAEWRGPDGDLYLKGGAPQFTFPFSIDIMLRLGIVSSY